MRRIAQELKKIIVAALAAVVIVFVIMVAMVIWTGRDRLGAELQTAGVTATPPAPEEIAARVVPMPAAGDTLPLRGQPGVDRDGFPSQQVDRVGLLAMLLEGKYEALESAVNETQARFEQDPRYEDWAVDAVLAFRDPDPRVGAALREWSQAKPSSWAALAAKAQYWRGVAWRQRGAGTAGRTSDERLRAFAQNVARAATLFREALTKKPSSIGSATGLVWALLPLGDAAATERAYRSAIAACPSCARPRYAYFRSRLPRWGGSVEALQRIVAEAQAESARSPRLANFDVVLRAHRCRIYLEQEDDLADNADCADAARRGFYGILLKHPARLAGKRGDLAGADALITRALSLSNERAESRRLALVLSLRRGRAEDAAARLLRFRRLDPTNMGLNSLARDAADALVARAQELSAAGDRSRARTLLEQATWLHPHGSVESARADCITAGLDTSVQGIDGLRSALQASPDSFEAAQDLDYALSPQQRWDEILPIWNRYLEAHPRDPRAYRERSGTLHAMGRQLDALADLDRACALGLYPSCERAGAVHREQQDRATLRGE